MVVDPTYYQNGRRQKQQRQQHPCRSPILAVAADSFSHSTMTFLRFQPGNQPPFRGDSKQTQDISSEPNEERRPSSPKLSESHDKRSNRIRLGSHTESSTFRLRRRKWTGKNRQPPQKLANQTSPQTKHWNYHANIPHTNKSSGKVQAPRQNDHRHCREERLGELSGKEHKEESKSQTNNMLHLLRQPTKLEQSPPPRMEGQRKRVEDFQQQMRRPSRRRAKSSSLQCNPDHLLQVYKDLVRKKQLGGLATSQSRDVGIKENKTEEYCIINERRSHDMIATSGSATGSSKDGGNSCPGDVDINGLTVLSDDEGDHQDGDIFWDRNHREKSLAIDEVEYQDDDIFWDRVYVEKRIGEKLPPGNGKWGRS